MSIACNPIVIGETRLCSGGIGTGTALFNYWCNNNCFEAYSRSINTADNGNLEYNPTQQNIVQDQIIQLFNNYQETNVITDDITDPKYNPFQNNLIELCTLESLPGICTKALTRYCDQFTREQVINSDILTSFCGCYTTPDSSFVNITGNAACDPLCHRALTSQRADNQTGELLTCPQNVCVIDNVTINAINSNITGGININNICSGCSGDNGCLCVVSGVNLASTLGSIGVTSNIGEFCGENSVCIVTDDEGNTISSGPCPKINSADIPGPVFNYGPNIAFLILVVVLIVLVIAVVLASRY
jgi:hypothetical protein